MFRRPFLAAVAVFTLALAGSARAATAPELFRKMKTEYSLAQYSKAFETLQALDTELEMRPGTTTSPGARPPRSAA